MDPMIIGEVTLACRGLGQGSVHPMDRRRDPGTGHLWNEHELVGESDSGGPRPGVGHCESWAGLAVRPWASCLALEPRGALWCLPGGSCVCLLVLP